MSFHKLFLTLMLIVGTTVACNGDDSGAASDINTSNGATSNNTSNNTSNDTSNSTACQPGELTCTCAEGDVCSEGLCMDGMCAECEVGVEECPCFRNGTCSESLRCNAETELCEVCPPGEQTCACDEGTCTDGLICSSDLCVPETCGNSPGREGCPCDAGNLCNEGLTCTDGGMCAPCSNDIVDCPCDEEGECTNDLVCDDEEELCRDEVVCDDLDCVANQQCDEGESGIDASCLEACLPGYTWNGATGMCDRVIEANCTLGAEGNLLDQCADLNRTCVTIDGGAECGPCVDGLTDEEGTLETCRAVVTCTELDCSANNRSCDEASGQTDASCGSCLAGYEENNGACERIPVANCTMGDVDSILSACNDQNRVCVDGGDSDATCGGCLNGFTEDLSQNCIPQVLCSDLDCAARGRACIGAPLAVCGECLPGTVLSNPNDPTSDCREVYTCDSIGSDCDVNTACVVGQCNGPSGCVVGEEGCEDVAGQCGCSGSFCVANEGVDAICAEWPCTFIDGEPDTNQAFREDRGECVACNISCGSGEGTGQTGNLWPYTLQGGRCLCETLPGYYADIGTAVVARPCDEDNDGWTQLGARSALNSTDPVMATNARCTVRSIDRFQLVNELGQEKTVLLCLDEPVVADPCTSQDQCGTGRCYGTINNCPLGVEGCQDTEGVCGCAEANPLDLYETQRNDGQSTLDLADQNFVPPYQVGEEGRPLRARELNSLTRACVDENGDFNDNGVSDVSEWHLMDASSVSDEDPEVSALKATYLQFAYFTELHQGWYERDPGAEHGRYIIQERSRCEDSFPLGYDAADGDYWRQCTRNRDSHFDALSGAAMIGFDFAHYSCNEEAETCALPAPITEMSTVGEIPPHGLCEVALPPADGQWRGMNHHSQFKCAVIDAVPPENPEQNPHVLMLSELNSSEGDARYQFNRCYADAEVDIGDDSNPNTPNFICTPEFRNSVTTNDAGFVTVRYNPLAYENGCINEWSRWPDLCPGYTANPLAVTGDGHRDDFGRLICGCTFNFGGPECDRGCPAPDVLYGGTRSNEEGTCSNGYCSLLATDDAEGRAGFWMCGGFEGSAYADPALAPQSEGGGYTIQGAVPQVSIGSTGSMCQDGEDCSTGWSLSSN